jgi:hypothetical protein
MKKTLYVVLFVLVILAVRQWEGRAIEHPPGVLVPESPLQRNLAAPAAFDIGRYRLTPRANYRIRARVLGRETYYLGDESELSPLDLALGWGVMSDQAVLDRIDITQRGRWYYTRYELPAPISDRQIIDHSSNVHMIPANSRIRDKLDDVRVGDLVQVRGKLVDVDRDDGFHWRTSLTRNDTGNGSCELFYVEQLQIEPRP